MQFPDVRYLEFRTPFDSFAKTLIIAISFFNYPKKQNRPSFRTHSASETLSKDIKTTLAVTFIRKIACLGKQTSTLPMTLNHKRWRLHI